MDLGKTVIKTLEKQTKFIWVVLVPELSLSESIALGLGIFQKPWKIILIHSSITLKPPVYSELQKNFKII